MIVSDLIQTVGTVVIGAPEGDMKKYFNSLEEVISMNPKVIIPSHGIAMGGVEKLKVTLAHRKMRESKIKELLKENKSSEEMLHIIYADVDERLFPYARKTISAHLKKLKTRCDKPEKMSPMKNVAFYDSVPDFFYKLNQENVLDFLDEMSLFFQKGTIEKTIVISTMLHGNETRPLCHSKVFKVSKGKTHQPLCDPAR